VQISLMMQKQPRNIINFLHTLWSQCDLFLNGTLVTQSNNNYPFRSYIETLEKSEKSQLSSVLWYQNMSGHFDERAATNVGYTERKEMAAGSNQIDMIGRLHLDLSFQQHYLLNDVEVRIRLTQSKNEFCLHGNAGEVGNKVSLIEVSSFCCKVKPNPSV